MRFGHRLHLAAAARAEHEDMRVVRHALGEQEPGHAVEAVEAGNETARPFGVARDRFGVLEAVEEMLGAFSHGVAPAWWGRGIARPCARGNRRRAPRASLRRSVRAAAPRRPESWCRARRRSEE